MGYALNKSELLAGEVMFKAGQASAVERDFILQHTSKNNYDAYKLGCIDLEDILEAEDIEILEHLIKQVWEG